MIGDDDMLDKLKPVALFGCIAACLLFTFIAPGFIFALDMIFVPQLPWPQEVSSGYLLQALLHVANMIIPADVLQKTLLLVILLLAPLGAYRLAAELQPKNNPHWAPYIAGLFYMINPFVYSRFMAGQFLILLGYAVLPFFIHALWRLCAKPSRRAALCAAFWWVAISIVSLHMAGIALCAAVVIMALWLWRCRRDAPARKRTILLSLLATAIALCASAYWLLPLLLGTSSTAATIGTFSLSLIHI